MKKLSKLKYMKKKKKKIVLSVNLFASIIDESIRLICSKNALSSKQLRQRRRRRRIAYWLNH